MESGEGTLLSKPRIRVHGTSGRTCDERSEHNAKQRESQLYEQRHFGLNARDRGAFLDWLHVHPLANPRNTGAYVAAAVFVAAANGHD